MFVDHALCISRARAPRQLRADVGGVRVRYAPRAVAGAGIFRGEFSGARAAVFAGRAHLVSVCRPEKAAGKAQRLLPVPAQRVLPAGAGTRRRACQCDGARKGPAGRPLPAREQPPLRI